MHYLSPRLPQYTLEFSIIPPRASMTSFAAIIAQIHHLDQTCHGPFGPGNAITSVIAGPTAPHRRRRPSETPGVGASDVAVVVVEMKTNCDQFEVYGYWPGKILICATAASFPTCLSGFAIR